LVAKVFTLTCLVNYLETFASFANSIMVAMSSITNLDWSSTISCEESFLLYAWMHH